MISPLIHHNLRVVVDGVYRMPFFETSAATGQNVDRAVEALLNRVMLRIESIVDKSMFQGRRKARDEDEENSSCRC